VPLTTEVLRRKKERRRSSGIDYYTSEPDVPIAFSIAARAPVTRLTLGDAMDLPRRRFLHLAAGTALVPTASRRVWAQAYPARPVRVIIGFPPGGPSDLSARLIGQRLSQRLGQPFVIENRPGGASNIATEAVARAAADGHSLLLVSSANAVNASLYDNLNFNFIRDIAPVAGVMRIPIIMVANASIAARTVPEFIAYAKANPGKVAFASPGNGTTAHLAGEQLKMSAGIDMVHVPYRGSAPALTDLLAGQVQTIFDTPVTLIEHIKTGTLHALAVGTTTRAPALPDVPPMADFLPGYEVSAWFGFGAPRNTPAEIVDRLNREINAALADPIISIRLTDLGATLFVGSAAEFGKFWVDETEKWGKVVRTANIKPE
jgi:tripartite-type tricarboxylate transporter receptor subunit TctC